MKKIIKLFNFITTALNFCAPLVDLVLRIFVATVFWKSGMVKCMSMNSTVWLFTNEYHVPLLTPYCAAYLSVIIELAFPVLLVIGLAGRLSAGVLFVFNLVAVMSYPGLHDAGVQLHTIWGLMLLVILTHGPGKLSLDYLLGKSAVFRVAK